MTADHAGRCSCCIVDGEWWKVVLCPVHGEAVLSECTCPANGLNAYCRVHGLCDPAVDC